MLRLGKSFLVGVIGDAVPAPGLARRTPLPVKWKGSKIGIQTAHRLNCYRGVLILGSHLRTGSHPHHNPNSPWQTGQGDDQAQFYASQMFAVSKIGNRELGKKRGIAPPMEKCARLVLINAFVLVNRDSELPKAKIRTLTSLGFSLIASLLEDNATLGAQSQGLAQYLVRAAQCHPVA
ncbi:hypothetical protein DFH06DRAFT_1151596 [Mycena polygramma]|nr:hypothetical protein DFH06DRAFT_1151596 [Mycena polygramma]